MTVSRRTHMTLNRTSRVKFQLVRTPDRWSYSIAYGWFCQGRKLFGGSCARFKQCELLILFSRWAWLSSKLRVVLYISFTFRIAYCPTRGLSLISVHTNRGRTQNFSVKSQPDSYMKKHIRRMHYDEKGGSFEGYLRFPLSGPNPLFPPADVVQQSKLIKSYSCLSSSFQMRST